MSGMLFEIMGAARRGGRGLRGLGALDLVSHAEVETFQREYNVFYRWVNAYTSTKMTGGEIDEDGKYASQTHGAVLKLVSRQKRIGKCASAATVLVNSAGPNSAIDCINDAFSSRGVTISGVALQSAWTEWKEARRAASSSGGTDPDPEPSVPSEDAPGASGADTGWSTGTWVAVGLGAAGAVALMAWLILRKKKG
jgi:hypothetical protein